MNYFLTIRALSLLSFSESDEEHESVELFTEQFEKQSGLYFTFIRVT
jgi:hypothetical protein